MEIINIKYLILYLLLTSSAPLNFSYVTATKGRQSSAVPPNSNWTKVSTTDSIAERREYENSDVTSETQTVRTITIKSLQNDSIFSTVNFDNSSTNVVKTDDNVASVPGTTGSNNNTQKRQTNIIEAQDEPTFAIIKWDLTTQNSPVNFSTSSNAQLHVVSTNSNAHVTMTTTRHQNWLTETVTTTENDLRRLIESDVCADFSNCDFVSTVGFQYCRCDNQCSVFGDCCFDSKFVNASIKAEPMLFECLPYSTEVKYDGIMVVNRCPESMIATLMNLKCRQTDIQIVGPCVVNSFGIVYQNRYCAECNGEISYDFFTVKFFNVPRTFVNKTINSTDIHKMQSLFSDGVVRMEMIAPERVSTRRCFMLEPAISNAPECNQYFLSPAIVDTGSRKLSLFKNRYCIPPSKTTYCVGQFLEYLDIDDQLYGVFPLSIMFPFSSAVETCANQVNGLCLERAIYSNYQTFLDFALMTNALLPKRQLKQIILSFVWSISTSVELGYFTVFNGKVINNASFSCDVSMAIFIEDLMQGSDLLNYEQKLKTHQWITRINLPGNPTTITAYTSPLDEIKFEQKFFKYDTTDGIKADMVKANISAPKNWTDQLLCRKMSIECELTDLSESSNLYINRVVCLDKIHDIGSAKINDVWKIIITYVGLGISVVAIIFSIIVYRVTGMYKSIPGANVENISVSLLLSNIVFLVGVGANDYHVICYSIGVTLHFLWLSVFSFKSIALVHMCHNLRKMSTNMAHTSQYNNNKRLSLTALGIALPLVVIAASLLLDNLKVSKLSFNYAGPICFPTGFPANVIFVSAPIGLSVLINILSFICIAADMKKQSLASRHIRKSSSFQHIPVFARISAVTGIFWITGILGAVFPNEIIEYVFIVSCSLQGFLVALANMTTKRVIRKIKERFHKPAK